jgi:ATP-dependent DNA helicase DinG
VNTSAVEELAAVVDQLDGVHRPSQVAMVEAVVQAFADGEVLLVQAGTGTGKSLGYLVPAAHTIASSGGRVVVSTATLALQRQLLERDLPAVADAQAQGRELRFAVLKGRGNYVCQARLAGVGTEDVFDTELPLEVAKGALEEQVQDLRSWAAATKTGDRDDYPDRIDGRVWRSMSATGRECVGPSRCSFADDCFSEQAKSIAATADIVVTNHALLALDALDEGSLLPEHDFLVVDEAHEFVARATAAATADLTVRGAERALRWARALVSEDIANSLAEAISGFEIGIVELGDHQQRLAKLPGALVDPVAALRDAAHVVVSAMPKDDSVDAAVRHRASMAAEEVHEVAGRLLSSSDQDVIWSGGSGSPGLHVAPLSVADEIAERLQENRATVLTSATLTLGGKFDSFAHDLGLVAGSGWQGIDVGTPFDYGKQGILYVAADVPKPGRDGASAEVMQRMVELVEAAGGRSLVLLSSWRAVDSLGEHLVAELSSELEVLVQRRGEGVAKLVAQFAADETSVLVGTMSLFQGVDVPGAACQLVIIDRIPFPRPDDPVLEARSRRAEEAGGNGFMEVSVPRAALLLAQGSGRLIRKDTDKGVVAVLDSRLATARYGTFLLRSMPPFWRTTDRDIAFASLRRLASNAEAAS